MLSLVQINVIEPEIKRRCRICRVLFCCGKCRARHERNKHPDSISILEIMDSCNICSGEPLILRADNKTNQLLDHIAKIHLPAFCHKCLQVFLSREDLLKTPERCDGHSLGKHKALDFIEKPDAPKKVPDAQISGSTKDPIESNNNHPPLGQQNPKWDEKKLFGNQGSDSKALKQDIFDDDVQKCEIDSISDALEATAPLCNRTKDGGITTSTPMASGMIANSQIESPQVSDIASPSSDIEITQGAVNEMSCQAPVDKKPGILVKGTKISDRKHTPRVKFAASPVRDKSSSICKKRHIKYTPRREFITNPRFQEILKGFEANKFAPQPPLRFVTSNTCPDLDKKKSTLVKKIGDNHGMSPRVDKNRNSLASLSKEKACYPEKMVKMAKIENEKTEIKEIMQCTNCNHTAVIKLKEVKGNIKDFTGTPSFSSEGNPVGGASTSNDFTPHGIGQFGTNFARTALTKKFENFKESPDTCESDAGSNGDEPGLSTTHWFTPLTKIESSYARINDLDQEDSPLELKANNVFYDLEEFQDSEKEKSGGIWNSVTGVVKSALGLVLKGRNIGKFKRSHSVTFEPSVNSPRPILKRCKSGDASSPIFLYSTAIRRGQLPVRLKGRKPLRKKF